MKLAKIKFQYPLTLYSIVVLAICLRFLVCFYYVEVPGDGPIRAFLTYAWYDSPSLEFHGWWLPGFKYITGLFSYLISDPLYSTRIFNVLVGTGTVLVFFFLVREIYNQYTAFVSALTLAVFPQHVALSATSLTEPFFIFLILLSIVSVTWAINRERFRRVYFITAVVCFMVATTIRYEAWALIPILPLYYFLRTRRLTVTIGLIFVLAALPFIWLTSNYLYYGDPFFGVGVARLPGAQIEKIREYSGMYPMNLWSAGGLLIHKISAHIGLFAAVLAGIGLVDTCIRFFAGRAKAEEVLLCSAITIFYIGVLRVMMDIGYATWDRYLMFGSIVIFPVAIYAGRSVISKIESYRWLFPAAFIGSILLTNYMNSYQRYVTSEEPIDSQNVASWLRENRAEGVAVLMTRMDWQSSYIPLYDPTLAGDFVTISPWSLARREDEVMGFICRRQPRLLISMTADEEFIAWIENFTGTSIDSTMLTAEFGRHQIYDIAELYFSCRE